MNVPIYMLIKKDIEENIKNGIYKAGDKIPSERELCQQYNISRMTARQALTDLVNNGVVIREKGRGTFIKSPQLLQRNLRSFTDTLRDQGSEPSTKVIEFSSVHHLTEISKLLGISQDSSYYKIKRLRCANNLPVALEVVYLPKQYCPNLEQYSLEGSLYNILEKHYGYILQNILCDIEACTSSRYLMELFGVTKQIPLLKAISISCTNDTKLFYEEAYYNSSLYKYQVDITKR